MLGVRRYNGDRGPFVHKEWEGAVREDAGHQHHHLAPVAAAALRSVCVWLCALAQVCPGVFSLPCLLLPG